MAPRIVYESTPSLRNVPTPTESPSSKDDIPGTSSESGLTPSSSSPSSTPSLGPSLPRTSGNFFKKQQCHQTISKWFKDKWGWVVTVATFIIFFVTYGFFACYGVLFVAFQDEFNSGATSTGWVGSLASAVAHFAGPLTNYLVHKLRSPRRVIFMGVACCFLGIISSSFVTHIYFLFGTMGIVCGLGLNMVAQATLVLIVQYFPDKNSTRSVSLACTGPTIGMLILSPFMNLAIETIGWRNTLRYFGLGILFIGSLCCLPMLPVSHKTKNMLLRQPSKNKLTLLKDDLSKIQDSSSPPHGSMKSIKTGKSSCEDIRSSRLDCMSLQSKPQTSVLLHKDMWVLCVSILLTSLAQTFYNINYLSHLTVLGITSDEGAIMLTLYAAGQIIGELMLSAFADRLPFSKIYMIAIASLVCGLATIPITVVSMASVLRVLSAVLGFVRAPRSVLVLPVAIEMFGIAHVQQVTAAVLVAHGVGFVAGALVMGLTYDNTGSYTLSIIICIILLITASVLYASIPLRQKYKHTKQPSNLLPDQITDGTESEMECHVLPLSNLVAPVRELFPILVTSQESLNHSPVGEYVPARFDYHSYDDQYEDFIDDTNEADTEVEKSITCALKTDLLKRLVSNGVVIHMSQSPTSTAGPSHHASIDSFIKDLSHLSMKQGHPLIDKNFDELSLNSSIAYFPQDSNPDSPKSNQVNNDILVENSITSNQDKDSVMSGSNTVSRNDSPNSIPNVISRNDSPNSIPNVISRNDSPNSIPNAVSRYDSPNSNPNVIENTLKGYLEDNPQQFSLNDVLNDSPTSNCFVIENPLSECSEDLLVRGHGEITSECSVSHVILNGDYTETILGNANTLHDNVGIDRKDLIDQINLNHTDSDSAIESEQIGEGIDDYSIKNMKRQASKVSSQLSGIYDLINPIDRNDCSIDQVDYEHPCIDQTNSLDQSNDLVNTEDYCDQANPNNLSISTNHYIDLAIQIEHSIGQIDCDNVDVSINQSAEASNDLETQSNDHTDSYVSLIDLSTDTYEGDNQHRGSNKTEQLILW